MGGKNADILRHIWPHFLLYGQCMRLLAMSPVRARRARFGIHDRKVILASH